MHPLAMSAISTWPGGRLTVANSLRTPRIRPYRRHAPQPPRHGHRARRTRYPGARRSTPGRRTDRHPTVARPGPRTDDGGVIHVRGKGNKDRRIPVGPQLLNVLGECLRTRHTRFTQTISRHRPAESLHCHRSPLHRSGRGPHNARDTAIPGSSSVQERWPQRRQALRRTDTRSAVHLATELANAMSAFTH
jgi:hypothetical protein